MRIFVCERPVDVEPGATVFELKERMKPSADVVILNGAAIDEDRPLNEGDHVVVIARGERPSEEELEALLVARHTPGVHARVKAATVGVAGLGGLGSPIAAALCRIGVGRLVLADFDVVEPSNLNRQQYFLDQIGRLKTDALAETLARINPYVEVETHAARIDADNVADVFGRVDVLVEAFDRPEAKAMLLDAFHAARPDRPLVMASGLAGHGPAETIGVRRLGRNVYVVGDLESAAEPGRGLMAPRVGVAAHVQANLVLRLLLGEEDEEQPRRP